MRASHVARPPIPMTIFLLALALSMDAFAAALSQGAAAHPRPGLAGALRVGLAFGLAQGLMPLLGWSLGLAFAPVIRDVDHWVAFGLLVLIGGHMVQVGLSTRDGSAAERPSLPLARGWPLLAAAVATSVDAAAAGVTLSFLDQPVGQACAVIGLVTLALSTAGVLIGRMAGALAGRRAEIAGGLVLIGIGTKILVEHLFFGG